MTPRRCPPLAPRFLPARDAAEWDLFVVDDLFATGGSAATAVDLLRAAGPHLHVCGVVVVTDILVRRGGGGEGTRVAAVRRSSHTAMEG